jgi:hypothetical protein
MSPGLDAVPRHGAGAHASDDEEGHCAPLAGSQRLKEGRDGTDATEQTHDHHQKNRWIWELCRPQRIFIGCF